MLEITNARQVIKEKTIPGYKPAYTGLVDVARKTWKINGAKSMFQGMHLELGSDLEWGG